MEHLTSMLKEAVKNPARRQSLIATFQREVWNLEKVEKPDRVREVLQELAYDFDFYVPDPALRREDPSYYGDERLVEEIEAALRRLKATQAG